jgi:hypothetical protein
MLKFQAPGGELCICTQALKVREFSCVSRAILFTLRLNNTNADFLHLRHLPPKAYMAESIVVQPQSICKLIREGWKANDTLTLVSRPH